MVSDHFLVRLMKYLDLDRLAKGCHGKIINNDKKIFQMKSNNANKEKNKCIKLTSNYSNQYLPSLLQGWLGPACTCSVIMK